jgi:hypothetical protein
LLIAAALPSDAFALDVSGARISRERTESRKEKGERRKEKGERREHPGRVCLLSPF